MIKMGLNLGVKTIQEHSLHPDNDSGVRVRSHTEVRHFTVKYAGRARSAK
jgi:hypothetical protein